MVRRLASAIAFASLAIHAPAACADELPAHLEVSRSDNAGGCPDAVQLAAAVAETVGHDALDPSDGPHAGRFAVVFARLETGFVATIEREEPRPVARTLSDTRGSCRALAGAVVVALALMLDAVDTPPPPVDPTPSVVVAPSMDRPRPSPAEPPAEYRRQWYGWQTLLLDGPAALLTFSSPAAGNSGGTATLVAGLSTFALGAPIVHGVHRRWGMFGASIGLRIGAVGVFAAVGATIAGNQGHGCAYGPMGASTCSAGPNPVEWAFVGGGIGGALASAIDSTLFARERVRVEPSPAPSTLAWAPMVVPVAHGMSAGVGGAF